MRLPAISAQDTHAGACGLLRKSGVFLQRSSIPHWPAFTIQHYMLRLIKEARSMVSMLTLSTTDDRRLQ
jgi:hypothetical protein